MQGFFRCNRIIDEQGNSPLLARDCGDAFGRTQQSGQGSRKENGGTAL